LPNTLADPEILVLGKKGFLREAGNGHFPDDGDVVRGMSVFCWKSDA
jgi:hypothetical protein